MLKRFSYIVVLVISLLAIGVIKAFQVGDKVFYHDNNYYVVSDNENSVTMIKASPLTTEEVNTFGEGHANYYSKFKLSGDPTAQYNPTFEREAVDLDGYGSIAFYQNENCKFYDGWFNDGCRNSFETSEVKYVVDAWAKKHTDYNDLVNDSTGYSVRLLTLNELINKLSFIKERISPDDDYYHYVKTNDTPPWVYSFNYWLMTPYDDSNNMLYVMYNRGEVGYNNSNNHFLVRPVINVAKDALINIYNTNTYSINDKINYGIVYNIGDTIEYNGIKFRVIRRSDDNSDTVTVVKSNPLTVEEVLKYGNGFINKGLDSINTPKDINGYGGLAYYSSSKCNDNNHSDCNIKYDDSDIKHIIDNWYSSNINITEWNVRILNKTDLEEGLKYVKIVKSNGETSLTVSYYPGYDDVKLSNCWSGFSVNDSLIGTTSGNDESVFISKNVYDDNSVICPVIELKKYKAQEKKDIIVDVPDTKLYKGVLVILFGVVIIGLVGLFIINNKFKSNRQ